MIDEDAASGCGSSEARAGPTNLPVDGFGGVIVTRTPVLKRV